MKAYIQTKSIRPDGTCDSFCTHSVPCIDKPLWWQKKRIAIYILRLWIENPYTIHGAMGGQMAPSVLQNL